MIRIKMEKHNKRKRAENWSEDERNLLKNLVNERFDIIENKNTDTNTNMQKLEAWKEIWERFILLNRKPRTMQKLREQWKRMKIQLRIGKRKDMIDKEETMGGDTEYHVRSQKQEGMDNGGDVHHHQLQVGGDYMTLENGNRGDSPGTQSECLLNADTLLNQPKMKSVTSRMYQSKGTVEYKRSLLELNRLVKEQLTNCALEEHRIRMQHLREEHHVRLQSAREMHQLNCENERLKAELVRLEIEIKRKQLNEFVM